MSDKQTLPAADEFKEALELLADKVLELLQDCQDRSSTIIPASWASTAARSGLNSYDMGQMAEVFLKKSIGHWSEIKTREEESLVNQVDTIFSDLSFDTGFFGKVSIGSSIFNKMLTAKDNRTGKPVVADWDKDEIWDLLQLLVDRAIDYHDQRSEIESDYLKIVECDDQELVVCEAIAAWKVNEN